MTLLSLKKFHGVWNQQRAKSLPGHTVILGAADLYSCSPQPGITLHLQHANRFTCAPGNDVKCYKIFSLKPV